MKFENPVTNAAGWFEENPTCDECGSHPRPEAQEYGNLSLMAEGEDGEEKECLFCSPACVRKHVERGAIKIATRSYEGHVEFGWEDDCHTCKQVDKNAQFIIIEGPLMMGVLNGEIGGHFCSMKCFLEGLRAEEAHYAKVGHDPWYQWPEKNSG